MPFKRSSSDISLPTPPTSPAQPTTPSPSRHSAVKEEATPVTEKRKNTQKGRDDTSPSSKKSKTATAMNMGANGDWTAEKRELIMDRIIANGYKATDISELATEFGLSKKQLANQFCPGRKGSLRDRAVKAVAKD